MESTLSTIVLAISEEDDCEFVTWVGSVKSSHDVFKALREAGTALDMSVVYNLTEVLLISGHDRMDIRFVKHDFYRLKLAASVIDWICQE